MAAWYQPPPVQRPGRRRSAERPAIAKGACAVSSWDSWSGRIYSTGAVESIRLERSNLFDRKAGDGPSLIACGRTLLDAFEQRELAHCKNAARRLFDALQGSQRLFRPGQRDVRESRLIEVRAELLELRADGRGAGVESRLSLRTGERQDASPALVRKRADAVEHDLERRAMRRRGAQSADEPLDARRLNSAEVGERHVQLFGALETHGNTGGGEPFDRAEGRLAHRVIQLDRRECGHGRPIPAGPGRLPGRAGRQALTAA